MFLLLKYQQNMRNHSDTDLHFRVARKHWDKKGSIETQDCRNTSEGKQSWGLFCNGLLFCSCFCPVPGIHHLTFEEAKNGHLDNLVIFLLATLLFKTATPHPGTINAHKQICRGKIIPWISRTQLFHGRLKRFVVPTIKWIHSWSCSSIRVGLFSMP